MEYKNKKSDLLSIIQNTELPGGNKLDEGSAKALADEIFSKFWNKYIGDVILDAQRQGVTYTIHALFAPKNRIRKSVKTGANKLSFWVLSQLDRDRVLADCGLLNSGMFDDEDR